MGKGKTEMVTRDWRKWAERRPTAGATRANQAGKFDNVPLGREPVGTKAADLFRLGRKVPENLQQDRLMALSVQAGKHGCAHDLSVSIEHRPAQVSLIGHAMAYDPALQQAAARGTRAAHHFDWWGARDELVQPGVYGGATLGRAKEIAREQLTASAVHQATEASSLSAGAAVGLGADSERLAELLAPVAPAPAVTIVGEPGQSEFAIPLNAAVTIVVNRSSSPEVVPADELVGLVRTLVDTQSGSRPSDYVAQEDPSAHLGPTVLDPKLAARVSAFITAGGLRAGYVLVPQVTIDLDVETLAHHASVMPHYADSDDEAGAAVAAVLASATVLERPGVEELPALPRAAAAQAVAAPVAATDSSLRAALKEVGRTVYFLSGYDANRSAMLKFFKADAVSPLLDQLGIIPGVLAHKLFAKNPDVSSPVIKLLVDLRSGRISLEQFNAAVDQLDDDLKVQRTELSGGMSGGKGQDPQRDGAEAGTGA